MDESEYQKAKRYTINILARKNYASFELRKKLCDRSVPEDIIEAIVAEFAEAGYIDDKGWLVNFIRQESVRKHGMMVILQKMRQKGVPEYLMDDAVGLLEREKPAEQIAKLIETRYRKYDLNDSRQREKAIAALMRRGYRYEDIKEVFSSMSSADEFAEID